MRNYENGLDTKAKILNATRTLFYQKGYEATTFKDIASLAGVNQGLIVYHFKTKANLADTVFRDYIKESLGGVEKMFPERAQLTQYFIDDFLYFRLIYENAPFRNFMNTCCSNGLINRTAAEKDAEYYRYYREISDLFTDDSGLSGIMMESLMTVFDGMKNQYTTFVCKNYQRYALRDAAETYIFLYCRLFGIREEQYGARMMEAEVLSDQVEMRFENFQLTQKRNRLKG